MRYLNFSKLISFSAHGSRVRIPSRRSFVADVAFFDRDPQVLQFFLDLMRSQRGTPKPAEISRGQDNEGLDWLSAEYTPSGGRQWQRILCIEYNI